MIIHKPDLIVSTSLLLQTNVFENRQDKIGIFPLFWIFLI